MTREVSIRSIQHFLYCPHRWGLLEIDCAWQENAFVTKANLLHSRVHDPDNHHWAPGKKIYSSVSVFHDAEEYNLYGVTDCIEVSDGSSGGVCIVEYKPTKPKTEDYHYEDLMQVFAQKICVDYIFGCDSTGAIYYADVKKRIKLPLRENFKEYDEQLKSTLIKMREFLDAGKIPPINQSQRCSGCSMKDVCIPSLKLKKCVKDNIFEMMENQL